MRAVRTLGSGTLSRVRVIHLAAQNLFWFEVNSAGPFPLSIKRETLGVSQMTQPSMPAWALGSKPLFPSKSLQQKAADLESEDSQHIDQDAPLEGALSHAGLSCQAIDSQALQSLSKKAKVWGQRY